MSIDLDKLMNETKIDIWQQLLEVPSDYKFSADVKFCKRYEYSTFDAELYLQNNGPGTVQRVLITMPKEFSGKLPAVVVPFYFPEAMVGFDLETLEELPKFSEIAMCKDLAERGFITITADAYHLTYCPDDKSDRMDFARWQRAGDALLRDYPQWCGCGKLTADTRLLIDMLEKDDRVDSDRIGIAGHSLGGKMAFYTGCLDKRIKVILASDFGINWDQTNWHNVWYWGDKVKKLQAAGLDHSQLLDMAEGKPFMLIAGFYDNMASFDTMQQASSYAQVPENLVILNHATGHRPPQEELHAGYRFLEKYLK